MLLHEKNCHLKEGGHHLLGAASVWEYKKHFEQACKLQTMTGLRANTDIAASSSVS